MQQGEWSISFTNTCSHMRLEGGKKLDSFSNHFCKESYGIVVDARIKSPFLCFLRLKFKRLCKDFFSTYLSSFYMLVRLYSKSFKLGFRSMQTNNFQM